MKEYDVTITETLRSSVTVRADSRDEAERIVRDGWADGKYVLNDEHFADVGFDVSDGREAVIGSDGEAGKIEVLLVEPGRYPRMAEIPNELGALQDTVGGYIQAVYPFDDPVAVVCDEEGKLNGSELNRSIRDESGDIIDIVAGTFFVCGIGEDDFTSLPKELQNKYEKMFHQPECFLKLGSRIMSVPAEPADSVISGNERPFKER